MIGLKYKISEGTYYERDFTIMFLSFSRFIYLSFYNRGLYEMQAGGTAADTSVLLARQQQGEQDVAGGGIVF